MYCQAIGEEVDGTEQCLAHMKSGGQEAVRDAWGFDEQPGSVIVKV